MKKFRPFLLFLFLLFALASLAVAAFARQDAPPLRLEITGVNVSEMPTATVTANVYDLLGLPVLGLTEDNFALAGDLSGVGRIIRVENITDNNLPIASVLVIDVSSSMLGSPINNAKLAAQAFVDGVGANDPVAIVTFGSSVRVLQDYTTDKAALTAAIASIQAGGETALYQGAYDAIALAGQSPTQRRAVVLLSDGAEYGDASNVGREAAAEEARAIGVPVYSIGLGFGIDRTYLQQLSAATSSQFYESPAPEQLTEIYTNLAAQLRSQYIITLDVPVPLDGTEYTLQLDVTTEDASANASAVLRAPIPVPIPLLPVFNDPLTVPTEITASVLADDPVESVSFRLGDNEPIVTSADAPTITVDPANYLPGDYPLIVSAVDDDGDSGSAGIQLTIGALPSEIALNPALASLGAIATPQTIAVEATGQTPAASASVAFNGGESTRLSEPFGFTIDPLDFAPGANTVTVSVTNEGGVTSEATFDFTVAALPPVITVSGLEDGQNIDAPTEFTVDAVAQEAVESVNVSVDEQVLEPNDAGAYTLDPINFSPGTHTVIIRATAANGQISQQEIDVVIAALSPQIIVEGLEAGETISEDREIGFSFVSQSPVIHVAVFVDGADLAHLVTPPFGFTLRVLDFAPGDHVMRVIADNTDGQSGTLEVPFSIAAEPAASATSSAITATQAAVVAATQEAEASATALQATQVAVATGTQAAAEAATAVVQMTQLANTAATKDAQDATATQVKVEATGTQVAAATQGAQQAELATQNAQATATLIAQVTQSAVLQATEEALASATAAAELEMQNAQASATAAVLQATEEALAAASATQNASNVQATQAVQATQGAQATATELANRLATLNAQMTATQDALATASAEAGATATADAEVLSVAQASTLDAGATEQAALNAQATQNAQVLATRRANATATRAVIETSTALAATEAAQTTATAAVDATASAEVNATATADAATAQATQAALETLQALALTATERANATLTAESADQNATQAAQSTLEALEATATGIVQNATATRNALETQTANNATATRSVVNATATVAEAQAQVAQATSDAAATRNAVATAERAAQITVTAQRLADLASATANANVTATAAALATETRVTEEVEETATALAQETPEVEATLPESTADAEALTPSPQATLTEVQATAVDASSNMTPIAIICIVVVIVIIILVLIMRGRGSSSDRR